MEVRKLTRVRLCCRCFAPLQLLQGHDPVWILSVLKHLMKKVLERLMGTVLDDGDEDEEADNASAQSVHCSLSKLCDWYDSKTKVGL